jgi:hypothetical protein
MSARIRFWPPADLELMEAVAWYEQQHPGLSLVFLRALDHTLLQLASWPEQRALIGKHTRRCVMQRFPFVILYVSGEHGLTVLGLVHARRDPKSWSDRVQESSMGSYHAELLASGGIGRNHRFPNDE